MASNTAETDNPIVVILGINEMMLAAARNLGRRGIPVIAVQPGAGARSDLSYSRFAEYRRGPALDDEDRLIEFLEAIAVEHGQRPVLLPVQDQLLLWVHARRDVLRATFDFFVWDSPLLAEIGSKAGLAAVVREYALPAPRSAAPQSFADIDRIGAEFRFPCIVKPEFTNDWWTADARRLGLSQKAIEVGNADELRDVFRRSDSIKARTVVQEKIVGPDAGHLSYMTFVPDSGEPMGEIVVLKHRVYPPRFGVACFAEAAMTEDAIEMGRGVLARLGYRGFVSVQFKRDERDGRLYLIEINLRLPLAVQLPISAGIEFPWYYYCASLGRAYEPGRVRVGTRWMSFGRDLKSMKTYSRDGTHSWLGWLADLARRPAFAIFSPTDPGPVLAGWRHAAAGLLGRLRGKSGESESRASNSGISSKR